MPGHQRIAPGSPFEEQTGFTRAIRVDNRILVSGTVGIEADGSVAADAAAQADRCFALILDHIAQMGGTALDLVRVRIFVTDMADAASVSASFARHCRAARPTATLVGIAALYDPRWKVEIEAEAVLGTES